MHLYGDFRHGVWAISLVGIGPILTTFRYSSRKQWILVLVVINAVVAVWAAPAVKRIRLYAKRPLVREQALGQTLGWVVAYILFAVAGVCIIAGASIHGADTGTLILFSVGTACLPRSLRYWLF